MPRLIINPDSPHAWIQELSPGEFDLGRSDENHIALDHASVSSAHCRLTIADSQVILKDLGSVSGTFIRGELVEEARLRPGTTFRVGEVEIRFEIDPSEKNPTGLDPAPLPNATRDDSPYCRWHKRDHARHFCRQCNQGYCDLCVETRMVGSLKHKICRKCGSPCDQLSPPTPCAISPRRPGFLRQLPAAFTYPLQGNGLILILSGGAIFAVLGFLPLVGVLISGYVFNYAKRIVASSANGEPAPPDWPDFTNWWDDILVPYLHMIALVVLTFGPAILLALFFPHDSAAYFPLIILTMVFGAFLAPMGMLALAMFDDVSGLNPVPLLWTIFKIPGPYFIAAIVFGGVVVANQFLETLLGLILPVPIVGAVLAGFLNLYLLAVAMRILGLLYASEKQRIGWFHSLT